MALCSLLVPPAPAGSQKQPQQAAQVNKTLCNLLLSSVQEDWRTETPLGRRAPLGEHFPATEPSQIYWWELLFNHLPGGKETAPRELSASPSTGHSKPWFVPGISGSACVTGKRTWKSSTSAGKVEFIYLWLQLLFKMENLKRSELLNQKGCLSFVFKHAQVSELRSAPNQLIRSNVLCFQMPLVLFLNMEIYCVISKWTCWS